MTARSFRTTITVKLLKQTGSIITKTTRIIKKAPKKHSFSSSRSLLFRKPAAFAAAVGLAIIGTAGALFVNAASADYYVSPNGSDTNSGTSATAPFKTIQKALDSVGAGSTITLATGTYREALLTKANGSASSPIVIKGPETGKDIAGRYKAVLVAPGSKHAIDINNSYYVLKGFTIDGQDKIARSEYPSTPDQTRLFKDSVQSRAVNSKLVYIGAADTSHDLTGIRIDDMFLNGSGGECLRMRNRATGNVVNNSVIQWCGMYGDGDDVSQYKYHNSEGVYIGTSPKSTTQPMYADDASTNNTVSNSILRTFGSECFDVKENAHDNSLVGSECSFNDEPVAFNGSNLELRGDHNKVINTAISDSRGFNVKLNSDEAKYDKGGNSIQASSLYNSDGAAISNGQNSSTLGVFCGVTYQNNASLLAGNSLGDTTQPCADKQPPTIAITSPVNGATVSGAVVLSANASDDVGVAKVDFFVDGSLVGSSVAAPYQLTWKAPVTAGSFTISAKAYDAANNIASSQVIVSKKADAPAAPANLTAKASAASVSLTWTPPASNGVALTYDVYRNGAKITNTAQQGNYNDTALAPSTTYTYYLKAVDSNGMQSPASAPASATTPGTSAVSPFEAESGTVKGGMSVQSDSTASGGKYVLAKSSGTVTYTVNVAARGTYMVAGWIKAPNKSSDSLNVKADNGAYAAWDLQDPSTSWTYDATGNPTFSLVAGTHTLTVQYREPNAALDRLVLVKQ